MDICSGVQHILPDFLSRAPVTSPVPGEQECAEVHLKEPFQADVVQHHPLLQAIKIAKDNSEEAQAVKAHIASGWPARYQQLNETTRSWWHFRHLLRVSGGLIVDERNRVYVPPSVRGKVLEVAHDGHPGVHAMVSRVQADYFWPGLTSQAKQWVAGCVKCAELRPQNTKQLMISRPMPMHPGATFASDYFEFQSKSYLVLYNVFSQFPYLVQVASASAPLLVRECRKFFLFSGVPVEFWADRGTAFMSHEFQQFLRDLGVQFKPSSVEHSQSNGAAEAAVKILKKLKSVSPTPQKLMDNLLALQNTRWG